MASVVNRPNGHKWIQFKGLAGKRQTVRLGKTTKRQAESFRNRLERLLAAASTESPADAETTAWLAGLSPILHQRVVACGLANRRQTATVGLLLDDFEESLSMAKSTRQNVSVILTNLREFFGLDREVRTVTAADAKTFRAWLADCGGRDGGPLAPTTVSRRTRRAKQVFGHAIQRKWLAENPFAAESGWNEVNREKDFLVGREIVAAILAEIFDLAFRAIVTLARFGGLRCPSEILPLEWPAVNWERQTLTVVAAKTKTTRIIPLFPEMQTALNELWEQADEWEPKLFPNHQISGSGLTDKLQRACTASRVALWPKPWQNMRATRESELLEEYPIQTVAAWLGHSPKVALTHYAQVAKEHHARAVGEKKARSGIIPS